MSAPGGVSIRHRSTVQEFWTAGARTGIIGAAIVSLVIGYLATRRHTEDLAQTVGNFGILLAAVFATCSCAIAARQRGAASRPWLLLALAAGVWTVGQLIYTYYGLSRDNVYPFPSLADAGCVGYALPAAAALWSFPRTKASSWRLVLDALVITTAVLFVSHVTVMERVWHISDRSTLARWTGVAYPIVDVAMVSIVLTLGMRQPAGRRLTWLLLGGGLAG